MYFLYSQAFDERFFSPVTGFASVISIVLGCVEDCVFFQFIQCLCCGGER